MSFHSYDVMLAARASTLSSTQRAVVNAIAFRADASGECWAAVTTIASDTGFSERAARDAIRALERCGALVASTRPGQSTIWSVHPLAIPQAPRQQVPPRGAAGSGVTPAGDAGVVEETPAAGAGTPAAGAPDQSKIHPRSIQDPSTLSARENSPDTRPVGEAELAIAELTARAMQDDTTRTPGWILPNGVQNAIRGLIRRGVTVAEVILVDDWLRHSGHSEAVFLRHRAVGWASIAKDDKGRWSIRLSWAKSWDAAGRPANEATGPPSRAAPVDFAAIARQLAAEGSP